MESTRATQHPRTLAQPQQEANAADRDRESRVPVAVFVGASSDQAPLIREIARIGWRTYLIDPDLARLDQMDALVRDSGGISLCLQVDPLTSTGRARLCGWLDRCVGRFDRLFCDVDALGVRGEVHIDPYRRLKSRLVRVRRLLKRIREQFRDGGRITVLLPDDEETRSSPAGGR